MKGEFYCEFLKVNPFAILSFRLTETEDLKWQQGMNILSTEYSDWRIPFLINHMTVCKFLVKAVS